MRECEKWKGGVQEEFSIYLFLQTKRPQNMASHRQPGAKDSFRVKLCNYLWVTFSITTKQRTKQYLWGFQKYIKKRKKKGRKERIEFLKRWGVRTQNFIVVCFKCSIVPKAQVFSLSFFSHFRQRISLNCYTGWWSQVSTNSTSLINLPFLSFQIYPHYHSQFHFPNFNSFYHHPNMHVHALKP